MGTSNFHNKNASRVFAIEIEDDFDYEDAKSNIQYALLAFNNVKGISVRTSDDRANSELRSFPAVKIAELWARYSINDIEFTLEVNAVVRSGYYAGANFDWETRFYSDESWDGGLEDGFYDIRDIQNNYFFKTKGSYVYANAVNQWLKRDLKRMIDIIEGVYSDFTTPLAVAARFSNGETIYTKCN